MSDRVVYGYFLKDQTIIAAGACGIGWNPNHLDLRNAIFHVMDSAWYRYSKEAPRNEHSITKAALEEQSKYFTTADDLHNFETLVLDRFIIPREAVLKLLNGDYSDKEWEEITRRIRLMDAGTIRTLHEYKTQCNLRQIRRNSNV